jgi:cellulose synthase (UDP-forming)
MSQVDKYDLWSYRRAVAFTPVKKTILLVFIIAGLLSIIRLFNWWFREEHIANNFLFILLSLIFWWGIIRTMIVWVSYLQISIPEEKPAPNGYSVAIFTTSTPGEPLSMFEKTLEACSKITYPHTTYLLDDTRNPLFKELAKKYGAVWLELLDYPGAKAGKINEALKRTSEDFILVLDPDHIPFPNFLDKVLGYFEDESVGFVQVSQAYYNQYRSFTAKGAAEQTYGFYGPVQMGMNGRNCAVAIGANCTFRRKALDSIGGHGIGLAEDLITSIRIHAAGWKSVYNPVIVSRGLVPEDLGSFCKQQLKWARGVHEVFFAELPRLWRKLTFWQKLSYSMISTYYFTGLTMFLFLLIPYFFLLFGWLPANMEFTQFLGLWLPLVVTTILIYLFVQVWNCHPAKENGFHLRGMFLKFACWPVFFLGFLISLWNGNIPYIPTAKLAVKGFTPFAKPLIIYQLLFICSLGIVVLQRRFYTAEASLELSSGEVWGMVAFCMVAFLTSLGGLYAAYESRTLHIAEPWGTVKLENIKTTADESEEKTSEYPLELEL